MATNPQILQLTGMVPNFKPPVHRTTWQHLQHLQEILLIPKFKGFYIHHVEYGSWLKKDPDATDIA